MMEVWHKAGQKDVNKLGRKGVGYGCKKGRMEKNSNVAAKKER